MPLRGGKFCVDATPSPSPSLVLSCARSLSRRTSASQISIRIARIGAKLEEAARASQVSHLLLNLSLSLCILESCDR